MFKTAAIFAMTIAIAAPAAADTVQIERALKVAPGTYTLPELVELMHTGGYKAGKRKLLIQQKREAFAEAVRTVNGEAAPGVTRAAR